MSAELLSVKLSSLDANPLRDLKNYPYNEKKLGALQNSIRGVGLWEGVIGRKHGNRIQIAFGHHRIEAAKRELGEGAKVGIIVRNLDDKEMLQFMGRENLEEYNSEFLVMLNTWEAAVGFLSRKPAIIVQPIEVSRLLGWIRIEHKKSGRQSGESFDHLTETAEACNAAYQLIQGRYLTRESLDGLSVESVRQLTARIVAHHEALEKMAKQTNRPAAEIQKAKKASGKAGVRVADDLRKGRVAPRDIKGQVDVAAYRHAKEAKAQTPLFAMFGKSVADSISKMLKSDSVGERLQEIHRALGSISMPEDLEIVKRISFECETVSERADRWSKALSHPGKGKVVPLTQITGGRN